MTQKNTKSFKKITEREMPAIIYFKDGKEYFVSESRLIVNPLKEQGYHAIYQIYGTKGNEEKYNEIKNGVLSSINEKIGERLRKFNDGIGEISVSTLEPVDCPFNSSTISNVMKFSTEEGDTSGIILINCYNYPDDVLVEMSVWTVDYTEEQQSTEIEKIKTDSDGINVSNDLHEITKEEKQKKQQINSIDWLWNICLNVKKFVLELGVLGKIILGVIFLVTIFPLFFVYVVLGIFYGILYFLKNEIKKESAIIEPKTKLIITYDWSGIRALTQIRHLNFIKQKTEEAICEYMEKTGFKWEKGLVANYKPELLKEGIAKSINQHINNHFDLDFSKTIEIGNSVTGGTFNLS